jgi:4-hydroxythreonine-4-phosphate dehydrogenase
VERVNVERIIRVIGLTHEALRRMGLGTPRIALAGLNPHAGEGGLFGNEEADIISPAAEAARAEGMDVTGPYPPDSIFLRASQGEFDAVIAMYHDQGHIPIKLLGFYEGVNVTLGLPIVRTSVDHGTAFDIVGTGRADERSLVAALRLAAQMGGDG